MERNAEIHFTRVLIEVKGVDHGIGDIHEEGIVRVIIPGWNPHREILIPVTHFEWGLVDQLGPNIKLLAEVNLAAEIPEELVMKNFEKAPSPIPENEL